MRTVAVVLGTRPEAIKLAPVVLTLRAAGAATRVCVTGQHREMVDGLLPFFGVGADADLQLMQPGQSLSTLASRALAALDAWFEKEKPVLVVGTTAAFPSRTWKRACAPAISMRPGRKKATAN
jgi:UDP-N-acetylglucosamine 2-epimerase